MDTPTLDNPPRCTRGAFITILHGSQQTIQNSERQNKPLATPTPSTMNATTTTNVLDRPL